METSWNLQPIILTKPTNSLSSNDGQMVMTPLMLDALNSSPNSIDDEKQFMIPQRRVSSGSYDNSYLNNQHHQYSVQGSTSTTPDSVGQSSGTASPDGSTQLTSDSTSYSHCLDSNSLNAKWVDRPLNTENCPSTKSPRYCYVFQQPNGSLSTMSDSASIISNSSAHSTITVPAPYTNSQSVTQTLMTVGSPFQTTNSLPTPSNPILIDRPSSVPLQQSVKQTKQEVDSNSTDFSSLNNNEESKSKKSKKRKSSIGGDSNQPAKKQVPNREPTRPTGKPTTISALTRRRLKIAEKSGEPMEKMHLLLTELTVEDLKIICRKYNLAISGTKSDLLRRLQPIEGQIDVESILLDAMQKEDLRESSEKPKDVDMEMGKTSVSTKPISTVNTAIPSLKIPVTTTTCNTNQFDMAISNYLLQHRKQISQQQGHPTIIKSTNECMENGCSCVHQTTHVVKNNPFPTTKTIYFAPSTTVMNGTGAKTTVIRVPIASFNPTSMDNSAASTVLSKKLCKLDNGPTFSYAETGLGSGGQFTLEASSLKNAGPPTSKMPKFVQISVPSAFCAGVNKEPQTIPCRKCKDKQPPNENVNDELQMLIKELSLGQSNAIENSTLTARILALHQQTIKAQYSKLYEMGKLIGDSQKVLQCQQGKIDAARKAMAKIKANKPNSIDTISQKLDISQLNEQHNQQTNELKTIQQNHQQLKADQEKLTKSVMEVQEEIHIDQAVEDVVRLIKTNRKTALLIVQLVHKFQCDRVRELNRIAAKKQEIRPSNCSECNADSNQPCNCANKQRDQRPLSDNPTPAIVTIDESDDEFSTTHQNKEEDVSDKPEKSNEEVDKLSKNKKKSKSANKRNNKPVSQRSEHTFAEVMEDIFLTVISNDGSGNDSTKENTEINPNETSIENPCSSIPSNVNSKKSKPKNVLKSSTANSLSAENNSLNKSMPFVEKTEDLNVDEKHTPFMLNAQQESNLSLHGKISPEQAPIFNNNIPESNEISSAQQPLKFYNENPGLVLDTNPSSVNSHFNNPADHQFQTPTLYNYMTSTTEINTVYTVNNAYTPQQYHDSRPNHANYHQRRAFLQQKRQTLCEQLEQIERQQMHNEMQNSYSSIDIDEELANLGDLNVEDLYNYDFDQLEVPATPVEENPAPFNMSQPPAQYMSPYPFTNNNNHSHLNSSGFLPPPEQPLVHQQHPHQRYSTRTFQHANSTDFEDILDLIRNGEKNRQTSMDFEDGAQATNAIYQELRLTDIDEMNWKASESLTNNEDNKQLATVDDS